MYKLKQILWSYVLLYQCCLACATPPTETVTFHCGGSLGSIMHQPTDGGLSLLSFVASPHHFPQPKYSKTQLREGQRQSNTRAKLKKRMLIEYFQWCSNCSNRAEDVSMHQHISNFHPAMMSTPCCRSGNPTESLNIPDIPVATCAALGRNRGSVPKNISERMKLKFQPQPTLSQH